MPLQKIKVLNDQNFISETLKYLNKNTRVIIISHILWNFGFKIPLKKLRKEINRLDNNPYLIVDGAQSFGHIDVNLDVSDSDIYAVTSHKWACGPEGLGAFFVSDKFIHETNPTIIGWKSLKREQGIYELFNNLYQEDARKFEIATSCTPLLSGFRKSLSLLEIDKFSEKRQESIIRMSNKLWLDLKGIKSVDLILNSPLCNGIVSFDIKNLIDKNRFIKELGKKNIWIRVVEDPKWFRVCIHQMTTNNDINLLVDQIKLSI